jgi:excisionase family DNA binding protein
MLIQPAGVSEGQRMADRVDEEYLTAADACALLGVKPATLYAYVSRGLVQSYKQGIRRQRLYRRAELEALLRVRADAEEATDLPEAASWVIER